eukprot:gene25734-biopygen18020
MQDVPRSWHLKCRASLLFCFAAPAVSNIASPYFSPGCGASTPQCASRKAWVLETIEDQLPLEQIARGWFPQPRPQAPVRQVVEEPLAVARDAELAAPVSCDPWRSGLAQHLGKRNRAPVREYRRCAGTRHRHPQTPMGPQVPVHRRSELRRRRDLTAWQDPPAREKRKRARAGRGQEAGRPIEFRETDAGRTRTGRGHGRFFPGNRTVARAWCGRGADSRACPVPPGGTVRSGRRRRTPALARPRSRCAGCARRLRAVGAGVGLGRHEQRPALVAEAAPIPEGPAAGGQGLKGRAQRRRWKSRQWSSLRRWYATSAAAPGGAARSST